MDRFLTTPLCGALGAEVSGLDLSKPLIAPHVDALITALHRYQILCVRSQFIDSDDFVRFGGYFGSLEDYPHAGSAIPTKLHIVDSKNEEASYNSGWHSDGYYYGNLLNFILLHAQVVPIHGGDTLWTSMYAAYDALSPQLKSLLEGLTVQYDFTPHLARLPNKKYLKIMQERLSEPLRMPIICEFRGRKSLFFFPECAIFVYGVPEVEGKWIINFLSSYIGRHEFVYRHRWREGDVIIWDNRTTMHRAVYDFEGHRLLHRLTVL